MTSLASTPRPIQRETLQAIAAAKAAFLKWSRSTPQDAKQILRDISIMALLSH
jgi:acyl-CoA reductase-like NAD-dependent aldehyde dehydrogenase